MSQPTTIALDRLKAHDANSNVMPAELFAKLARHIADTGRYPPIIVRPIGGGDFQILDGHHRAAALRQLGRAVATCVVWDVSDEESLVLLATLNRLQGRDDPRKRAALFEALAKSRSMESLSERLPEGAEEIQRFIALRERPRVQPARKLEDMPIAVQFFLLPAQKAKLDAVLRNAGGTREQALLKLCGVDGEPVHEGDHR